MNQPIKEQTEIVAIPYGERTRYEVRQWGRPVDESTVAITADHDLAKVISDHLNGTGKHYKGGAR